ncbi:MAG: hypothetical protein PEGG_02056 [Paraeggerthella hongkongensis]|uniref:hypothetical protein n=1 Tax=Paraeggerthella hominis TaxID=2897351 RepID=UPI001C1030B2|nr:MULTISPECIES: hypothetical protein [Paraeggerthella]MBU5406595.1 hypothetical protein [Paraeggerthella hongkongensis]MCD2432963.1 hypothetical protein [Paraeggerthella hominis]
MKATNKKTAAKNASVRSAASASYPGADELVARIGQLHGQELRCAVRGLDEAELLAFAASDRVSRAARIAATAALDDVDLLISLACADVATFVRRDALRRIEEVLDGGPVAAEKIERLLPCLGDPDLIAFAVALMDESGFDWCARCDRGVGHVLCAAMSGCRSINESVLLEDAFAQLAHCRPDLRADLQACTPESFIPRTVYTPMIASGSLLVDNVA